MEQVQQNFDDNKHLINASMVKLHGMEYGPSSIIRDCLNSGLDYSNPAY